MKLTDSLPPVPAARFGAWLEHARRCRGWDVREAARRLGYEDRTGRGNRSVERWAREGAPAHVGLACEALMRAVLPIGLTGAAPVEALLPVFRAWLIFMRDTRGWSMAEAARRLGCRPSTVRAWRDRGAPLSARLACAALSRGLGQWEET